MLLLFETAAGFAVFKLLDEKALKRTENLFQEFETIESASKIVKLKAFKKFNDTTEALEAASAAIKGKLPKKLKLMLSKLQADEAYEQLAVADSKLGNAIKDKLNIPCVSNTAVQELMRCIRSQSESLIGQLSSQELTAMSLGLAHSLSRYKLKFSVDKVDTMIVQAAGLLDDLDKELNNYVMRAREWYGWHFPELGRIITDHQIYVKVIKAIGIKDNASECDLSEIVNEDVQEQIRQAAEISMGTEISTEDIDNIIHLCDEVIQLSDYRNQLNSYLQNRMMAIAPNLTALVGEMIGARLISHAGTLVGLAKQPASTIQLLGAEKALFRALKTRRDTPKYGLLYHASLISKSSLKLKGKMARMLSTKTAMCTRVDAFAERIPESFGVDHKAGLELRLKSLEEGNLKRVSGTGKLATKWEKYEMKTEIQQYPSAADSTIQLKKPDETLVKEKFVTPAKDFALKRKAESLTDPGGASEKPKKKRKMKSLKSGILEGDEAKPSTSTQQSTEHGESAESKKPSAAVLKKVKKQPLKAKSSTITRSVKAKQKKLLMAHASVEPGGKMKKKFRKAASSASGKS